MAAEYGTPDVLRAVDFDVHQPGSGDVTIDVRAAGVNPTDWKGITGGSYAGNDPADLPKKVGYEVAGVIAALGPDTVIATGGGQVGDEVVAYRIEGGYATSVTVPAKDVFAKPAGIDFPEAANLLLVGSTAAQMLHVTSVREGETILVHGASGATGISVLQQAALMGARVVGTASEHNFDQLRSFGAEPVAYGDGLDDRVRAIAGDETAAALDCVGTDEAIDVSLALVADPSRIVTIAAFDRVESTGIQGIGGRQPESAAFRDFVRSRLIDLARRGQLKVPMSRTFPLREAADALNFLQEGHPGGKLALIP